ncbi:MAG: type II toxin-antitoxin system RelE/ParE family toxin [Planctomycetota bacterium]
MTYSLVIRPEAEEDLRQAYHWYEEQREGLGEDFLLCVEAALTAIQESPLRYPAIHRDMRRILVRRFPYGVFYCVRRHEVSVLAVFHCRRHPRGWQRRRGRT